jgi:hypothetical protein
MRYFSFIAISLLLQLGIRVNSSVLAQTNNANTKSQTAERDYFYHPYAATSAWNRVIGTEAEYSDDDSPLTTEIRLVPRWGFNTRNGWAVAVAKSNASDPLVTVTCSSTNPDRNINFPYQLRIPDHFPLSVNVPETSDGQIVIYDETTGHTHEFYKFKWNNGKPTADIHRTDDPDIANNPAKPTSSKTIPDQNIKTGNGHGTNPGNLVGTRAIGSACLAGLIRTFSMTEPDIYPQHALALELAYGQLSKTLVQWPATSKDYTAYDNTGNIPYGALVAIPPVEKGGPDLSTLDLTDAGMRIAKTLVYYGGYVTDRRGNNAGIEGDQYIPTSVTTNVMDDLQHKLIPHLRVITNNTSTQTFSGGGASLLDPTSNVPSDTKNDKTSIYPNPAKESINIQVSAKSEVLITDLAARVLLRKSISAGDHVINLNLKPGIYMVQVIGDDHSSYSRKLVVN